MTPDYKAISSRLFDHYPVLKCALNFRNPYELLVASRLSAQCTDKRVNIVCEELFRRWPDEKALAQANLSEVENVVRPCGLYRMKSKDIVAMAKELEKKGIPRTLEGFLELPGVGRKIANLLMGELYDAPGVVVADTHCIRLSNRLGFVENTKDPVKVEFALRKIVPPAESMRFCHALVHHGRECCDARKPRCEECFLKDLCKEYKTKEL
ncbi:MAG: endonuclease III [Clostridia bacterium]|nr:endonuclease III [Clostridia bacterium]